jgi:hypothetical protein
VRFAAYCLCGATFTGTVEEQGDASITEIALEKMFRSRHKGEGHGKTDLSTARSVRRRWPKPVDADLALYREIEGERAGKGSPLHREAVASVALDHDPDMGTQVVPKIYGRLEDPDPSDA